MKIKILIHFFFTFAFSGLSQSLHDDVISAFNFSPSKLNKDEQTKMIPLMDHFWNKVRTDTTKYLPRLREELLRNDNPPFFYFDGSQLLLSLSERSEDQRITLSAMKKTDIKDIDRRSYVRMINHFAFSNLNTLEAALKILEEKDYSFFIPEHAFYFNQGYSITYTLLPTNPVYYVEHVIDRFKLEQDASIKKSIVTLLWFTNSCSGNKFLKNVVEDKSEIREVIDYTQDMLTQKLKKDKYFKGIESMSLDDVRQMQRTSTSQMSDEAIYELDYLTKVLRRKGCK